VFGTTDGGYQLNVIWDLGDITKINPRVNNYNWSLQTGYLNYGQNFYHRTARRADAAMNDTIYLVRPGFTAP